ncbi:ubiquitin hydrolase family protein [Metarhizium album ARSEF 1941]|uniref:ubiquitinyl hydrolase 1 n=1 Tax=Metarhizium album (strain ARSEF 1941) TaxID=1081103 RepID=A0A0B2WIF8_METAS|nr:ubiquitin hydrolase family protein [Metarhizium album ARSEF 1941]KHN95811.1 ubiquitin hydrolase family protein [Metarhizium album ARSEF 1941]
MKEFPRKFLSLRDKNAIHRRSKSVPAGHKDKDKARPLSGDAFRAMFKMDGHKQNLKSDADDNGPNPSKIELVQHHLEKMHISNVTADYIRDIMSTNLAQDDPEQTADFIRLEQESASGIIFPYDPTVHMLGAENRCNVTCYLDSLLFAMFAKLDAFECMLKSTFPADDARRKLATLLRIWVNMLRSGKLIHTDLTKLIQETLSDCGWPDAKLLEQQDTSEAFAFLTETLQLPLLSLQVDLFHQGKGDKDDHKVVYERLLNLAIPPDPGGKGIDLEDCLEEYFNARVDVSRDHEEAKVTMDDRGDASPLLNQNQVRLIRSEEAGASCSSASPADMTPSQQSVGDPLATSSGALASHSIHRVHPQGGPSLENRCAEGGSSTSSSARMRSTSVIQRVVVDEDGRPTGTESEVMKNRARRNGSTVVKAVTIPAWQFFRLIPWHALTPNEPRSDSEVALNFDQRPVVGICLKRYAMTEAGQPQRQNTFVDVPDSLRLPHFMLVGGPKLEEDLYGLSTEYKLVLQSVVCHRGDSLHSGHYISFARVAPKLLTGNRRHNFDPPPDYEEAQWVKFDDLETQSRITYVDDIKQALKNEMPYLLFYQIVPMVDMPRASTEGTETDPPSYSESKTSMEPNGDLSSSAFGRLPGNHRDDLHRVDLGQRSKPPSIRLSADMDRPARETLDPPWVTSHTGSTPNASRRESMANTESPAVTPGGASPVMTPSDESAVSRLSRAASRFTLGRQSRPPSQSGEGRISFSMARLSGLMKASKEPLIEPPASNGLQLSVSNSTGPTSETSAKGLDSPVDGDRHYVPPQTQKHKHRGKAKDKEKAEKHKTGDQPERECTVM